MNAPEVVQLPGDVAAGGGTPVGASALNFFFASMTGFSNWVFWLMWLDKKTKTHEPEAGAGYNSLVIIYNDDHLYVFKPTVRNV